MDVHILIVLDHNCAKFRFIGQLHRSRVGRLALKPPSEKSDLDGRIFPNLYRF